MGLELFSLLRTVCTLWILEAGCLDLPNCMRCRLSKHQAYFSQLGLLICQKKICRGHQFLLFLRLLVSCGPLNSWAAWIVQLLIYIYMNVLFFLSPTILGLYMQISLSLCPACLSLKSCLVVLHMVSSRAALWEPVWSGSSEAGNAADDPVAQFRCQGSPRCSVACSQVFRSPEWRLCQVLHRRTIYLLEHDLQSWNFLERWTVTGCLSFLSLSLECCWRLLWCVLPEAVQWFSPQLSGCWAETVVREALLSDDFPRGGAVSVGHTCPWRRLGILYQPWQSLFEHQTIRALFSW